MGRKTKLSPEVQAKVVEALEQGNYFNTACRYAGIAPATGEDWKARGEDEQPRRRKDPIYVAFAQAVRAAEAKVQVEMIKRWQRQMPEDWRAIESFMKRRYPKEWGDTVKQEITGGDGGPVMVTMTDLLIQGAKEDALEDERNGHQ